jgi:hypothetical protein
LRSIQSLSIEDHIRNKDTERRLQTFAGDLLTQDLHVTKARKLGIDQNERVFDGQKSLGSKRWRKAGINGMISVAKGTIQNRAGNIAGSKREQIVAILTRSERWKLPGFGFP